MSGDKEKIQALLSTGGEIAGTATGGAMGFLMGGLGGAALGGALGVVISTSLSDVTNRVLSNREKVKVGATAAFALTKIKTYIDAGNHLREDGFFDSRHGKRPNAEQIFEGVLLKAKNEHEEKKTKILGNIFANTAFFQGFSVGEANHLLKIAEGLTYRKMCILALTQRKMGNQGIKLRENKFHKRKEKIPYETVTVLQEIFEMYNLGLIACMSKTSENYSALLGWTDIIPNKLTLTSIGKRYCKIMGLEDIPDEDIREVERSLG